MKIRILTCLHPTKADSVSWALRELDYFYCLHSILYFNRGKDILVYDNSLDDLFRLSNPPLLNLFLKDIQEWGGSELILRNFPNLYRENNDDGLILLLEQVYDDTIAGEIILAINGRFKFYSDTLFKEISNYTDKMEVGTIYFVQTRFDRLNEADNFVFFKKGIKAFGDCKRQNLTIDVDLNMLRVNMVGDKIVSYRNYYK